MNVIRPPFPRIITNSIRNDAVTCLRKFELNNVLHWKPKHLSIHLHAGGGFAKGLEATRRYYYEQGFTQEDAILGGWLTIVDWYAKYQTADGDVKTCERMCSALLYYFTVFPMQHDFLQPAELAPGKLGIEFSGLLPIDFDHPETGEPLLIGFRFDMLAQHQTTGDLYVNDEKTTSQLGPTWAGSYDLDSQFTEYCWAARQYDFPVVGAIVRGISILKNGHGNAQSIQMRPVWQIERWYEQMLRDLKRMVEAWESGVYDYNLSHGCKMYGGCAYRGVCRSNDPDRWLAADFKQEEYNPYGSLLGGSPCASPGSLPAASPGQSMGLFSTES